MNFTCRPLCKITMGCLGGALWCTLSCVLAPFVYIDLDTRLLLLRCRFDLASLAAKVFSSLSAADAAPTQDEPHTLRINQSSLLTPPAVIPHQAEQLANARRSAAQGSLAPYTIPLLADTQTRSSKNRVTWILKFTLPARAVAGATRRFSAVPRGYGPTGAQALEGAVRYANPFSPSSNSRVVHSRVHQTMAPLGRPSYLWSQGPRPPRQAPDSFSVFVANSRSINSLPSLMLGLQRMTRNWMPLPLNVVRWSALSINRLPVFCILKLQYDHQCPARSCPSGHYAPTLPMHTGHWPESFPWSASSYQYASWPTAIWTIIFCRGSVLLYSPSSHSVCRLWARTSKRQTFSSGHYGHRQGPI